MPNHHPYKFNQTSTAGHRPPPSHAIIATLGRRVDDHNMVIKCIENAAAHSLNALHAYPRNHPSLGILNELIATDSKSPLIVVVDSNNQAKTFDDEPDQGNEYGQGHGQSHSKSCPNHPDNRSPSQNHENRSPKMSNQEYETALYELLRTGQKMIENQARQGGSKDRQKKGGKQDSCEEDKGKVDSCEPDKDNTQQFLAEQCSDSVDSCGNFD